MCGLYLADMGADVIKVEEPGAGDASRRTYDAASVPGGDSSVFLATNRNKRSVALDLLRAEGRALFLDLVKDADVVIEAYRGGVAERLGIGYEPCATVNPRLVYCSLSAFGPTDPYREKPGLDMLVLVCPRCAGPRRLVGAVTEPEAVRYLLGALGLAALSLPFNPSKCSEDRAAVR